jgi:hypothetical protein
MIVSLNEVQRTCQKAMSGAGAPAGVDDDAAVAAVWLEGRGLPALGAVAAALGCWAGDASAMELADLPPEDNARRFDAAGRSAVFIGSGLLDLAVAIDAATAESPSVQVVNVTDPQFFLPPAGLRKRTLRLFCKRPDGATCASAVIGPKSGVALLSDWRNAPPGGPFEVSIECGRTGGDTPRDAPPVTLRQADLEARLAETLAAGLYVDDGIWTSLSTSAARTLVPSSPQSRARGAGPAAG